ncbi:MAG: pseudouridine synthase [Bacteroidetes bacterium]|jgi:23S rRNA pseudouridine2604 synthase|nr:pseudouridine synthase [Bacteroidota bacterium]
MGHERTDGISLNKFISQTGRCSRREADALLRDGRVTLNGEVARPGNRATESDDVRIDGQPIGAEDAADKVYLVLNKPAGIICTTERKIKGNIVDFVGYPERIFPIGRLDKPSTGLILLTNDGDIVNKILRAGNQHEKEYIVSTKQALRPDFVKKMSGGVPILGTVTQPCQVEQIGRHQFRIILTEGMNRQIRRMCEKLGYEVTSLERVRIMHIKGTALNPGQWRHLTAGERKELFRAVKHSTKTA